MVLCTPIVSFAENGTIASNDITWVQIIDNGKYMYVGMDNSKNMFEAERVFAVNKITQQNDPTKYDEHLANLDNEIARTVPAIMQCKILLNNYRIILTYLI